MTALNDSLPGAFVPERLTEARHVRGLSTYEVADRLAGRQVKVGEVVVRSWEQGSQEPTREQQHMLAWILRFPVGRWSMPPRDEEITIGMTFLACHTPKFDEMKCVECSRIGEFLCDQRGQRGQFICSVPLCVQHARAIDGYGDLCQQHVLASDRMAQGDVK